MDWASTDGFDETAAYIDLETAKVYRTGYDAPEMEAPEGAPDDIETSERSSPGPTNAEFGLGSHLPREFASEHVEGTNAPRAYDCFRRAGAYRRFRGLLERIDQVDARYAYEHRATHEALVEWAEENGIAVVTRPSSYPPDAKA